MFAKVRIGVAALLAFAVSPSVALGETTATAGIERAATNIARTEQTHRAWLSLDPAFAYRGLEFEVVREHTRETPIIDERDQFALEIDHFSQCIIENRQPFTPGEEGLQDQRIMAAIYRSASEGRPVKLERIERKDAFRGPPPQRD